MKIFSLQLILEIHFSGPAAMYLIPEKINTITFGYQEDLPKHTYRTLFACTHPTRICTAIRKAICGLGDQQ